MPSPEMQAGIKGKNNHVQNMRINLKVPYESKDIAKSLGARWDPARKCWYIVDREDLTPFMQWIQHKSIVRTKNDQNPKTTGSKEIDFCGCHVLPWEHCEHTSSLFNELQK